MNEAIRKQLYTYKRSLEDKKVYTSLYTILLLATLVVYGLFGILPLVKVTRQKLQTIEDLKYLNTQLRAKRENIREMRDTLEQTRFYISSLEQAITPTPKVEDYLVAVVERSGSTGFTQKNFYNQNEADGIVQIRTSFQGSSTQLYPLVEAVESLHRLTKITDFSYVVREDTAVVQLVLEIYYLPK